MTIFKCKMCGGTIEFEQGATVGICDSCGTKQTLPRLDDDRRANLYDRANHFRRNNDFDKAAGIYEQILTEDTTDAETYWSLVLCRYGIEYVEDPTTHSRVPTVNRAQFTSIFDDDNYKSAIRYADVYQRSIYEEEAVAINEIQKGILEISLKEEPFDVFICYKETDQSGRRTQDSVLANDLYHQLTQEGFKVFFSRITLEDKLGTAYEPYIFAALNSAKVMVVLGTKQEHFNAVWVKNEWSRYLALVKQSGGKKILIPAYRDMDPYDLPDEFSHLQAQDMSKLGFMQDLIRGIKKIVKMDESNTTTRETIVVNSGNANAEPLLRRAFMFLEDGEWAKADDFCEQVLNLDPENAQAYLGKLMAELHVRQQENLPNCKKPFDKSNNFQKAVRFGDDKLSTTLKGYISHINERNMARIYDDAIKTMYVAKTEDDYKAVALAFKRIPGFKNADALSEQCLEHAEICRKDTIYENAQSQMTGDKISSYEAAIRTFQTISGWKDADEQIYVCQRKIEEIKTLKEAKRLERERKARKAQIKAEKAAKKRKKIIAIITPIITACVAFVIVLTTVIIPKQKMLKLEASLSNVSVGSTIKFGSYEQDNNKSNGKEEIEWIVLAVDGSKALIISRYALDCQPYNSENMAITWEECSLRRWLNGTFYETAFEKIHQQRILTTTVTADENPSYDRNSSFYTNPGNDTYDKVFLLSILEANKYFSSSSTRQCQGTAYCYAQGTSENEDGNSKWWLRTPGHESDEAAFVFGDGNIDDFGFEVDNEESVLNNGEYVDLYNCGVRPALWINLGS